MKKLVRTRVGCFGLDDSLTLEQIEEMTHNQTVEEHIVPIDEMFPDYRKLTVLEEYENCSIMAMLFLRRQCPCRKRI